MSYLVVRCLVPGYEDYDPYGAECNAYAGFPDMWPEEHHAEAALYDERKEWRESIEMMRRYRKAAPVEDADSGTIRRALVSIAKENGWRISNKDLVDDYGFSPIYTIPPAHKDEEEEPTRWSDIVRWKDRRQAEKAKRDAADKALAEERKRTRKADNITIDANHLIRIMGDMLPPHLSITNVSLKYNSNKRTRKDIQELACAELAKANKWKRTEPDYDLRGPYAPSVYKIR